MVRLKNIKNSKGIAKCDFYPEDSKTPGHLVIDANTAETLHVDMPEGYEWRGTYVIHTKNALLEVIKEDSIPDERLVMWY